MNKTIVTLSDFNAIKKCMTEEEIRDKYGVLEKMSRHEYKKMKLKEKMKNRLRKEGKDYG